MAEVAPTPDPLRAPLRDAQGRTMSYLRLSLTDRCNFRCTYCSPASWGGKKDLLEASEFVRIASVFAKVGIRRVRLTGGEPLIRPDLLEIAGGISALPGIEKVAITTNASRLEALARPLREAGVHHLNVSLDTLSEETFRSISKQGSLADVLRGIDAAAAAGFESLKLNVVVMKGVNDAEAPALVRYAHARGITPRFIELMPFGQGEGVPTRELQQRLRAEGLLEAEAPSEAKAGGYFGPARYLRSPGGGGDRVHQPDHRELLRRLQPGARLGEGRAARLPRRPQRGPARAADPRRSLGPRARPRDPRRARREARGPPVQRRRSARRAALDDGHRRVGRTADSLFSPAGLLPASRAWTCPRRVSSTPRCARR